MKLIDNWTEAFKLYSVQMAILLVIANTVYSLVPMLQDSLEPGIYAAINAGLTILLGILRVISQVPPSKQ